MVIPRILDFGMSDPFPIPVHKSGKGLKTVAIFTLTGLPIDFLEKAIFSGVRVGKTRQNPVCFKHGIEA
jgi:hypothetical protein